MDGVVDRGCDGCDEPAAVRCACGVSAGGGVGERKLQRASRLVQLLQRGFTSSHFAEDRRTLAYCTRRKGLHAVEMLLMYVCGRCTFTLRALQFAQPLRDFLCARKGGLGVLGVVSVEC